MAKATRFAPKKVKYSRAQFQEAYRAWSGLSPDRFLERQAAWDCYCDVRDGLPSGTSAKIRQYNDRFLGLAAAGVHDD